MTDPTKPTPTPTPWSQGRVLLTRQILKDGWTQKAIDARDAIERRTVFSQFSAMDEGRSRIKVSECEREEDAALIVRAVNAHAVLVEALLLARKKARHLIWKNLPGLVAIDKDATTIAFALDPELQSIDAALRAAGVEP